MREETIFDRIKKQKKVLMETPDYTAHMYFFHFSHFLDMRIDWKFIKQKTFVRE